MATVVNEDTIRQLVGFDDAALEQVALAFDWVSNREADIPPIMHYELADRNGDIDVKGAYVPGLDTFAIKIASGFYDNPKIGLPSTSGLMVVISALTGICETVLLDNGYLTNLRTGLAGAVAARYLAPTNVQTVGIVGTGMQARFQAKSLKLVRPFEQLLVYGIVDKEVDEYIAEMSAELNVPVAAADNIESLVKQSQCVVTTTPSRSPLIDASMLHAGLHITAMGSDLSGKQELDPEVLSAADLVGCDKLEQSIRVGELQHHNNHMQLSVIELGMLVSRSHQGRTSDEQITVCDLSGVGTQDTAIAAEVLRRLARAESQ